MADLAVHLGDARELPLDDSSVDAVVTDPPYELAFMGRAWDRSGVTFQPDTWAEVLRVAKPGAYLLAFGGTRTYHRLTCAVEDAGWIVEDSIGCLSWVHAQGFPKGKSKLKPAWEPVVLARKRGTGTLNVDGCRIGSPEDKKHPGTKTYTRFDTGSATKEIQVVPPYTAGRWPTNLVLVHHPDCADRCQPDCHAAEMDAQSGNRAGFSGGGTRGAGFRSDYVGGDDKGWTKTDPAYFNDSGGASRFYPQFRFQAKAPTSERPVIVCDGQTIRHPTVKPVALMQWLVRLVTPPGGLVLDPFCGSGATLEAATREGFAALGFDSDPDSVALTEQRLSRPIAVAF